MRASTFTFLDKTNFTSSKEIYDLLKPCIGSVLNVDSLDETEMLVLSKESLEREFGNTDEEKITWYKHERSVKGPCVLTDIKKLSYNEFTLLALQVLSNEQTFYLVLDDITKNKKCLARDLRVTRGQIKNIVARCNLENVDKKGRINHDFI